MDKVYNGIVIFGEMGAGKDTFAEQLSAFRANSRIYNIGVLCREMMKVARINPTYKGLERCIGQTVSDKLRETDINIMCDYILAVIYEKGQIKYGWDNSSLEGEAFNKALLEQLSVIRKDELSIIVGGRTLTDVNYWRSKEYLIVGIKVSDSVRKLRLQSRDGEKTTRTSNSKHNTEADVSLIVNSLCDEIILNDKGLDDLRKVAKELLQKYNL
jgi:dephospho-CoA kinase